MNWVAFLRAVNVGGRTVKMDRLKSAFEAMGFREVATFIASGNVRFAGRGTGAALERRIEKALAEEFGFDVTTFVRSAEELCAVPGAAPFAAAEGEVLMVGFLKVPPPADAVSRVHALESPQDALRVVGRELWWRRYGGIGDSKLGNGLLEKALAAPMTIRNITTVRKLAALSGQAGPR